MDASAVAAAVQAAAPEAVLIALGGSGIWSRDYTCSTGTDNIMKALKADGGSRAGPRVVVCTSMGVGDSSPLIPAFVRWILKYPLADKEPQEAAVRASGLPFVIVRPIGLRDAAARGVEAVTVRDCPKTGFCVPACAPTCTHML
jgi:uncharacterized protein YbjT (DUF2867 family)